MFSEYEFTKYKSQTKVWVSNQSLLRLRNVSEYEPSIANTLLSNIVFLSNPTYYSLRLTFHLINNSDSRYITLNQLPSSFYPSTG